MIVVELCLLVVAILGGVAGGLSVYLTRTPEGSMRIRWGQRLFLATMLILGVSILGAACVHSQSLPLLGLCAGLLLVAMVWESPIALPTLTEPVDLAHPVEFLDHLEADIR